MLKLLCLERDNRCNVNCGGTLVCLLSCKQKRHALTPPNCYGDGGPDARCGRRGQVMCSCSPSAQSDQSSDRQKLENSPAVNSGNGAGQGNQSRLPSCTPRACSSALVSPSLTVRADFLCLARASVCGRRCFSLPADRVFFSHRHIDG